VLAKKKESKKMIIRKKLLEFIGPLFGYDQNGAEQTLMRVEEELAASKKELEESKKGHQSYISLYQKEKLRCFLLTESLDDKKLQCEQNLKTIIDLLKKIEELESQIKKMSEIDEKKIRAITNLCEEISKFKRPRKFTDDMILDKLSSTRWTGPSTIELRCRDENQMSNSTYYRILKSLSSRGLVQKKKDAPMRGFFRKIATQELTTEK
jgi:chromosome segregation ATPase